MKMRIRQYAKAMHITVKRDKNGYRFKCRKDGLIASKQLDMTLYEYRGYSDAFDKKEILIRLKAISRVLRNMK